MTTQEKAAEIRKIVVNHQDNLTAVQNAQVSAGLNSLVIDAMNAAFKNDLLVIFCSLKPASTGGV